jgi:alpha-galactosidase
MIAPTYVTLHSPACSAVWEPVDGGTPLWRYWGPRLADDVDLASLPVPPRPRPNWALAHDPQLAIFPALGMGWFGQSALLAHREGRDWTIDVDSCLIERVSETGVIFHLKDSAARLSISIRATLDPTTDVLTLATALTNDGDKVLDVHWLAAGTLPLPPSATHVRSFGGRYNDEFVPVDDALTRSLWRRENRRGLTSHASFPGAIVHGSDGTAYGTQLAWSGNHLQQIDWLEDGGWQWQMGEWFAPGEVRLAPGESLETPALLATCSAEGINGITHAFHRAVRRAGPALKPRPVHLNTWEAVYFEHDQAKLFTLASAAAAVGIERFVLDDGWFKGRNNDHTSLGDWTPDPVKYPEGLPPLARHVTSLGMEFGLWVEPEMISPDSDLFRAHPDWALCTAGRPLVTGRNQLALDMHRADVRDHLFTTLSGLLDSLPICYLKWDHNRDLTHAGTTPRFRQQVLGTYALIDQLRAAYPDVEIEACAGGGGRVDAGIASRTHRFWPSDNLDPLSRHAIHKGFLTFLPPERMGSHVGASPAHSTGRLSDMAQRCSVALEGAFGVELDITHLSEADRSTLAASITLYKDIRGILHGGRVWRGQTQDGVSWQIRSTEDQLILFASQDCGGPMQTTIKLPHSLIDAAKTYNVSDLHAGQPLQSRSGAGLRDHGLALSLGAPGQSMIFRISESAR